MKMISLLVKLQFLYRRIYLIKPDLRNLSFRFEYLIVIGTYQNNLYKIELFCDA